MWELLLAYVAALAGRARGSRRAFSPSWIPQALADGAYFAATIYGALGELDSGFAELERARDLGFCGSRYGCGESLRSIPSAPTHGGSHSCEA